MPAGLPSPRVVFALALAVFATGFALGAAAGPSASSSYAAGGTPQRVVVVLPAAAPATPPAPASAPPVVTQAPAATTPPPTAPELPAAPAAPAETPPAQTETTPAATTPAPTPPAPPAIKHVWLVVLTGQSLQDVFGPGSHSALLRDTLPRKGVLLLGHRAVPGDARANAVALLTGRTTAQAGDQALTDQLTGAGLTWKGYVEDDGDPATPGGCASPAPRNPFAAIPSIASAPECGTNVVGTDALAADVAAPDSTPSFSYVLPNACHDASPAPCAPGAFADTTAADGWLRGVLRTIRASAAYKRDGLVIVTVDRGPDDTPVGALLLSHLLAPGTTVDAETTHLSLLRLVDDLFGLTPLGGAADVDPQVLENLWSQDVHPSATTR